MKRETLTHIAKVSKEAISTTLASSFFGLLILSSCTNSRMKTPTVQPTSRSAATNPDSTESVQISTVNIVSSESEGTSGATEGTPVTTIFFDTVKSSVPISNFCKPSSASSSGSDGDASRKDCLCQFSWQEVNTQGGSAISIPRQVRTPVVIVQPNLVTCNAPEVFSTEITDGTQIKVTVIPAPQSSEQFTIPTFNFVKSKHSADPGNFKDAQGRAFMNIMRYSCYDQRVRGMAVLNKMGSRTNEIQATGSIVGEVKKYPIANKFCVAKIRGGEDREDGCEHLPPADNSAQSYYYNLYIRESEMGDINPGNERYICPTVTEALYNTGSVGSQGQYWPLDRTFALSLGKTAEFSVGVVGNTKVSKAGDPVTVGSSCEAPSGNGASGGGGATNTLVQSCLGFAAKPNPDGTCPYFRDSTGSIRFTYRLRRYIALLPQSFDTDGSPLNEPQATDTVYVVDRPIDAPGNPDPLKPYSMLGPKPCPSAYFDHKKVFIDPYLDDYNTVVSQYNGSYGATNDPRWSGKNIDGIEFPRRDLMSENSCAAPLPLLSADKTLMSLTTVHPRNPYAKYKRVFVRPTRAFSPHYVEDTSFQACAPLSDPFKDPPLHFSRSSDGNIAWCAESYPSSNNNVARVDTRQDPNDINSAFSGLVRPFTSHVVKSSASASCTFTPLTIPSAYPNAPGANPRRGLARHFANDQIDSIGGIPLYASETCDRTVVNPMNGVLWGRFPLLAPPNGISKQGPGVGAGVEEAIASDPSYQCTVTFDNGGTKTGKYTPTQGCCGANVYAWTGAAAAPNNASSAHLEPDAACLVPRY